MLEAMSPVHTGTAGGAARRRKVQFVDREHELQAEARTLPPINPAVLTVIEKKLMDDKPGGHRPPEQAARLLALCIALYKERKPFPRREVAAQVLGGNRSKYTVDAILSSKVAEGYLQMVVETEMGNVGKRPSIIKKRYFIPDPQLLAAANRAIKKS